MRVGQITCALVLMVCWSRATSQDVYTKSIEQARKEKDKEFRNKSETPLDKPDLKKFKGLRYFPIDSTYQVKARIVRNVNPQLFKMKTTTSRLPNYLKYADLVFTLHDTTYQLEVYHSPEISARPGYADYYFVPFTDLTNGTETYEVGRYIDLRLSETDETVVIDFNRCYNPYCSYSARYSCPIPPAANHLPLAVRAGEKKYKDVPH